MEFTTEQKEQIRQAKESGERRVTVQFTPEQRNEWQLAVQQELACKDENREYFNRIRAAAERPAFFGPRSPTFCTGDRRHTPLVIIVTRHGRKDAS